MSYKVYFLYFISFIVLLSIYIINNKSITLSDNNNNELITKKPYIIETIELEDKKIKDDNSITIAYICHGRFNKLRTSVDSAKKYYPKLRIVAVDDGKIDYSSEFKDIDYYKLKFDVGPSKMRNVAASLVESKYLFITDDDITFTEHVDLYNMQTILNSKPTIKMVTGALDDRGLYGAIITPIFKEGEKDEVCDNAKLFKKYNDNCIYSHRGLDIIFTTTKFFVDNPWDESNSVFAEHTTHFRNIQRRAKKNNEIVDIVSCKDMVFHHNKGGNSEQYKKDRSRGNKRPLEWYSGCKMVKKKILITGCGYSSTGFFSSALKRAGYNIGHEVLETNGMSAWFAASKKFPIEHSNFDHIFALIRDPLKVVRSWLGTKWDFVHKTKFNYTVDLSNEVTIKKSEWDTIQNEFRVLEWWYSYTNMALDLTNNIIIAENITGVTLLDLCRTSELPDCNNKKFDDIVTLSKGYNSHKKKNKNVTWDMLEKMSNNTIEENILIKSKSLWAKVNQPTSH